MEQPHPTVLSRNWSSSLGLDRQPYQHDEEDELDYGEDDLFVSSDESFALDGGASAQQERNAPSSSPEYSPQLENIAGDFAMDVDSVGEPHQAEEGELVEGGSTSQVDNASPPPAQSAFPPIGGGEHLPHLLAAAQKSRKQKRTTSGSGDGEKRCAWREAGKKRPGPYDRYKQEVAFNRPPPGKLRAWDEDSDIKQLLPSPPIQRSSGMVNSHQPRRASCPVSSTSNGAKNGFSVNHEPARCYPSPPPSASERMSSFEHGGPHQYQPSAFPPSVSPPAMGMSPPTGPASMRRPPPVFSAGPPHMQKGVYPPSLGLGPRPGPHPQQHPHRRAVSENTQSPFRRPLPPQEACAPPPPPPHIRTQSNPSFSPQRPPLQRPVPPHHRQQQQQRPPFPPHQQQPQQHPSQPSFFPPAQPAPPSMPFPTPDMPFLNPAIATVALQMGLQLIAGAMQSQQQAMAASMGMGMEGGMGGQQMPPSQSQQRRNGGGGPGMGGRRGMNAGGMGRGQNGNGMRGR